MPSGSGVSGVSGTAVAATAAGGILLWSGIKGVGVSTNIRNLISGKAPSTAQTTPIGTPAATGTGAPTGSVFGGTLPIGDLGGGAAANQNIARLLASPYGWSAGQQWNDLVSLWTRESGWNNKAKNSSSGAYGIAQALPPTKYPFAGQEAGGSHASVQIAWGLSYIKSRYGSPSAAWAHETSIGWY